MILALDHGTVRTGVAVSDETGTLARPLTVVERVGTERRVRGAARACSRPSARRASWSACRCRSTAGSTARRARARAFAARLAAAVEVPVDLYDERFTSKLADQRGGAAARDARAAATLLEDYLRTVDDQGT